ncbi:MAG: UDP-N-acetylmuramoyl-L-alanyl-D-glutamate--2,6-diaminopimelate ligase [Candidatus Paceibacterota bacterium]|jgi:UDP-N-acetylmuramoyl-L-alanyl-D-glutamate--2,6-diaminopimelate ligase
MAIIKKIYHYCLAFLGALIYRFPSRKIFVVGITGTKGKSTTLELINAILEAAGKKTALLSSIRIKINKESDKNLTGTTMPGRFFIQKFLRKAVDAGCEYALVEVTSQGIIQYRHRFINWGAVMFTNLTPEHIEAHGGFEKYREAKVDFFRYAARNPKTKLFLINKEDANANYFLEAVAQFLSSERRITLFSKNQLLAADYRIPVTLSGDFNLENVATAINFTRAMGIKDETIKKAVENFGGVTGRMEIIQNEPFRVIIDYAHTPDSLEAVYKSLLPSRLVCVFGSAGGGRDKWKRPELGKIAAKYCAEVILTDEEPYDEDPTQILSQIKSGIKNSEFKMQNLHEILDRKEAIRKAISLAKKGDTVIITGKGHEPFIKMAKGKKIPWNERKVVEEVLKQ